MAPNLVDCVIHWKKKIDKNPDEDTILNVIRKLSKIPITHEILQTTHIGKTIRNLAKRNDIVGENAKTVLNKWRNIFVNMETSRSSKEKSIINNKDNVEKSSSKQYLIKIKANHHNEKKSSHELSEKKHKKNSLHYNSSYQSSEKQYNMSSSFKSSQSLAEYDMKKSHLNVVDFHHNIEVGITNSSDSQDAISSDDRKKNSSSNDEHPVSSIKRKLTSEEKSDTYMNSHPKKNKPEKHASCDSKEQKKCRIPAEKDELFSHNLKKEQSSSSHSVKHSSSLLSKNAKHNNSKVKNLAESEKSKSKVKVQSPDGFTSSSISFEDCLGFSDVIAVKKKKSSKSQSSTKQLSSDSVQVKNKITDIKIASSSNKKDADNVSAAIKKSYSSKEKLSGNISKKSTMFYASKANSTSVSDTQPNFTTHNLSLHNSQKETRLNDDVIKFTSSRKEKTAIYSGRKSSSKGIPTLAQCCYRVLIESIDILGPMADTPYKLLKPVLEKCTPNQLFTIEKYNPHLLYDTNELWEIHCKCDYKLLSPLEHETWRDVYLRGFDEHEEKLKNINAKISASMLKATPVRQLKLAFIDSYVKPPREVLRRQAKHRLLESGANVVKPEVTSKEITKKIASSHYSTSKLNTEKIVSPPCSSASSESFVADKIDLVKINKGLQNETPNPLPLSKGYKKPVALVVDPTVSDKDFAALSLAAKKPKVAPLMAKTLKTMKQCFRR